MNLPNALTTLRILLVPAFLLAYFNPVEGFAAMPLCIFLAAGLTDCLDGFAARKLGQITSLGKILDPIADKLLTAAVIFSLVYSKVIHWLLLAVIVVKEFYMGWGAAKCLRRKITVQADIFGKLATLSFYPAVLLAWPWHGVELLCAIGRVAMAVSVLLSVIAAVHYTLDSVKKWEAIKAQMNAH